MPDPAKLTELEQRIRAVRENIRVLTEQAAAYSGAADEERNADRISEQDALLAKLLEERKSIDGSKVTGRASCSTCLSWTCDVLVVRACSISALFSA